MTLETKLVESDTVIFEPMPGNAGTQFLCPGIAKSESDRNKKKSRFVKRYIHFSNEYVPLEPGKTLGNVQSCKGESLPMPRGHEQYVIDNIIDY